MKEKICISINKTQGGLCFGIKHGFIRRAPDDVTEIRIIPAETALQILAEIKEVEVPA